MSFDSGKLTFLEAAPGDAEALVALRIEAMRESLENVGRFDPARARARFLSTFSAVHTRHIDLAGQRVGFYVVKPRDGELLLDHLYVKPVYQGQGIGAAVLQHVFAQAASLDMPVRVGALRGSRSNAFYRRHGFIEVAQDEFDIYYVRA